MSQPYLISGQGVAPNPFQSQARSFGLLKTLIVVWLLAGAGFLIWKLVPASAKPAEKTQAAAGSVTAISTEDLLHHMDLVEDRLQDATGRLKRAEAHILQSIPSVQRNYLLVEKQHLENALAAIEAARRDLEQGREDTTLIHNSLKKEHELK
jgi:hypothetical protein